MVLRKSSNVFTLTAFLHPLLTLFIIYCIPSLSTFIGVPTFGSAWQSRCWLFDANGMEYSNKTDIFLVPCFFFRFHERSAVLSYFMEKITSLGTFHYRIIASHQATSIILELILAHTHGPHFVLLFCLFWYYITTYCIVSWYTKWFTKTTSNKTNFNLTRDLVKVIITIEN